MSLGVLLSQRDVTTQILGKTGPNYYSQIQLPSQAALRFLHREIERPQRRAGSQKHGIAVVIGGIYEQA
jgi:hypothetical protein